MQRLRIERPGMPLNRSLCGGAGDDMPGWKAWRDRHPDRDKESEQRTSRKAYLAKKRFVSDYLSTHPCVDCGEKDPIVLEFDHVRGTKKTTVTRMSMNQMRVEIQKCEVRCANCHRRRHAREEKWLRSGLS
jgi:hypothetical protein